MARVTIRVEREGGSTIKIEELSVMPLFTDEQTLMLVQEAFIRTCRALGVVERPEPPQPDPGGTTAPEAAPAPADTVPAKLDRKAA